MPAVSKIFARMWCVGVLVAMGLSAQAGTTNWLESAKKFKEKAIEHLRQAELPSADKAQCGKNALAQLNVARMLLETKYQEPRPKDVVEELEEINSLLYWTRKMLPVDAGSVEIRPVESESGKTREQLAKEYFEKAEEFARRNPKDLFLQAVKYFEVADRFQGTSWSVKANGISLEIQRRMRAASPAPVETGPDRTTLIKELGDILARPEFTPEEKLEACDKLLGELAGDDPLRAEIAAIKAVLAAQTPAEQVAAAATYFKDFAQGRFAAHMEGFKDLGGEQEVYDALIALVKSTSSNDEKAKAARTYLERFPNSPRKAEVEVISAALSAKYSSDEAASWLKYRLSFPTGVLKDYATNVLKKNESTIYAQLKSALSDGDESRFKAIAQIYLEITPKGPGASEVRSLLDVLATSTVADRLRLGTRHLSTHAHGALSPVFREVMDRWAKGDEDAAFRRLADTFAAAKTPDRRVSAANDFLKAYPRSAYAPEVRAALAVMSLDGTKAKLEAARKYIASYPEGAFLGAIREQEQALARQRAEELYRAAKVGLSDPKTTYTARIAACEAYLAEFPEGDQAQELRAAIDSVKALIAEENAAFEKLNAELTQSSSLRDAIKLCEDFLQKYAAGPHFQEVTSKRQDLLRKLEAQREAEAFAALKRKLAAGDVSRIEKIESCLQFLKDYGQGLQARDVTSELRKLAPQRLPQHSGPIRAAAFSSDSKYLVTCDSDRAVPDSGIWVWELPSGTLQKRYKTRPAFTASSLLAMPNEQSFLFGEAAGGLLVWRLSDGGVGARPKIGRGAIKSISASADGKLVATASFGDGKARLWDPLEWLPEEGFPAGGGVAAAAISPTGDVVAVGTVDGRLRVYKVGSKEPTWSQQVYPGAVDALAFSPAGSSLASASKSSGKVCLWGALSGNLIWEVEEPCTSLAFVGAGALLTGPSLRAVTDGRPVADLEGAGPVAASPDGKWAFTCEGNGGILWYLPALIGK